MVLDAAKREADSFQVGVPTNATGLRGSVRARATGRETSSLAHGVGICISPSWGLSDFLCERRVLTSLGSVRLLAKGAT